MKIKQLLRAKIIFLFLAIAVNCNLLAQTSADSLQQSQTYYNLGVQYKDGIGVRMNFTTAFAYFQQAAALGNVQSVYALAYMHYKGFGCKQDYKMASALFAQGAALGKDNSMYFYGLCFRNGYGVEKNEDSATYWLKKADSLGYPQATMELKMPAAENSNDSVKALVQQIKNAAIPGNSPLNQFTKVPNSLPTPQMMAGKYGGWLIQYDWSGLNIVSVKKLMLTIKEKNDKFSGLWLEGSDTANISAELHSDKITFSHTKYKRKDHYSPDNAVAYDFQDANLSMIQQGDSLYLAGNIAMFSPDRKEPSKPLFIALARKLEPEDITVTSLNANPNPFSNSLNVNFRLGNATNVIVQLLSINGTVLYQNNAGELQPGNYQLRLQPGSIAPGTYFLNFVYGNKTTVIKVTKAY